MMGKALLVLCLVATCFLNINGDEVGGLFKEKKDCLQFVRTMKSNMKPLIGGSDNVIINVTDTLCKQFTEQPCDDYKEDIKKIFAMVEMHLKPKMICSILHPDLEAITKTVKVDHSAMFCKGCKYFADSIKKRMNNESIEKAKETIQQLCQTLSPQVIPKELCDERLDNMIEEIVKGVSPGKICHEIELCNSSDGIEQTKSFVHKLFGLSKLPGVLFKKFHKNMKPFVKKALKKGVKPSPRPRFLRLDRFEKHLKERYGHPFKWFFRRKPKLIKENGEDGVSKKMPKTDVHPENDMESMFPTVVAKTDVNSNYTEKEDGDENIDVVEASVPAFDAPRLWPGLDGWDYKEIKDRVADLHVGGTDKTPKFGIWDDEDDFDPFHETKEEIEEEEEKEDELEGDELEGKELEGEELEGKELPTSLLWEGKSPFEDLFKSDQISSYISKTMTEAMSKFHPLIEKFRKELFEIENATIVLGGLGPKDNIACTVCTIVVQFITWEVKTVNASVELIEKEVKALCALYPIKAAQDACKKIVDEVDEIVQLIEKDLSPGDICKQIGLCNSTTTTTSTLEGDNGSVVPSIIVRPTGVCEPVCKYFKGKFAYDLLLIKDTWMRTKQIIVQFCEGVEDSAKCFALVPIFEKAERQLGGTLLIPDVKSDENLCKCFKNQPIFVTEESDNLCQLCKQMEKGLVKDLSRAKLSMEYLVTTMERFCAMTPLQSKAMCVGILKNLNTSFVQLEKKMLNSDLCPRMGYCDNNMETALQKFKKTKLTDFADKLFPSFSSIVKPLSFGCEFCQTCMKNIEKTLATANRTSIEEDTSDITPALKEGFSIFCQSQGDDEEVTSVCKTISNGMEIVQKFVQKKSDKSSMCRMFDMC